MHVLIIQNLTVKCDIDLEPSW